MSKQLNYDREIPRLRAVRLCGVLMIALATADGALAQGGAAAPAATLQMVDPLQAQAKAIFAPLPERAERTTHPITNEQIVLGKKLYNDTILSVGKDISCNSCHDLKKFGVDGEPTSPGHKGQRGDRNSPTVFNSALHTAQFWDGRAATVEEQALGPITNPVEMAMPSSEEVIARLKADKEYPGLFKNAFPENRDPITYQNIGLAIGSFERTLLTPSRFDDYLKGDTGALSDQEKAGLKAFIGSGCIACHSGVGIGGGMYQKIGLVNPYKTEDLGRFNVTKNEADKYVFKVPSLRNIEKTGPYFHDGKVKTLQEAVKLMGFHQTGRQLADQEVQDIVAFLNSLTGKVETKD